MAAQVEQRASNGGINNVSLDNIDDDALLSRAERRPLTLSRCRNLYQAPEFVQRITGEDSVLESNTVRFECKVKGFPKPTIKWYKDEEILELDTRISVESLDQGIYALVIADVTKKDEATYRCRIENNEGSSSSTIYLSVKGSSRSPKRRKSSSPNRRIVSYPSLFPTIEEKIVEEEKEEEEVKNQQPSPLSKLYESNKLRSRHTWPKFVGEWAFANDEDDSEAKDTEAAVNPSCHRRSPCGASDDDDVFTDHIVPEITQTTSQQQPNAFLSKSSAKESSDLETSRTTTSESNLSSVPLHTRMDNRPPVPSSSNTSLFVTEPNTHERTMSNSNNNNNNSSSSSSNSNVVHSSNTAGGNNNNNNNSNNNNDNNNNRGNISRISVNRPSDNASLSECHSNVDNFGRDHRPSTLTEAVRIPRTIDTENSTTTEGVNRGEMVEDQQDPDQYVSIDETYNIGGGMLTSFVLLTSFTFCALCIKITPGIFMVSIFMATFMFQVIRQLNSM